MRLFLVVVLLILMSALPASAHTYREQRALHVAELAWGTLPCGGNVTMTRVREITDDPTAAALARPPCALDITYQLVLSDWSMYCSVIVHEIGHLLGRRHSADPHNVMYPGMMNYWRCRHSPIWYTSEHESLRHQAPPEVRRKGHGRSRRRG